MKYLHHTSQRHHPSRAEVTWALNDGSGSMYTDDYDPTRLEGAIQANRMLIETKARLHPQDQLGIIGFTERAGVLHPLATVGQNAASLARSLDKKFVGRGGTNFTPALKLAEKKLFSNNASSRQPGKISALFKSLLFDDAETADNTMAEESGQSEKLTRRIILLTDGESCDPDSSLVVAERLKRRGVIIECIGIAGSPAEVDEELLQKISSPDASGQPRYYFIKDSSQLIKKYQSMAYHIRPVKEDK